MTLSLEPGSILFHGRNGQGKSNLLEAMYILSIAKSPRTYNESELLRRQTLDEQFGSKISATVERNVGQLQVEINFQTASKVPKTQPNVDNANINDIPAKTISINKHIRINSISKHPYELIGQINMVMFSANDLSLISGPPAIRRRYMDILISQTDQQYLKTLQRYQRTINQRNHLLKMIRAGYSEIKELEFWNNELVSAGKYIMIQRQQTLQTMSAISSPIHTELTGNNETLKLKYLPNIDIGPNPSEHSVAEILMKVLEIYEEREISQGFSMSGPHRDDIQLLINSIDAGKYGSRGQWRTAILAMKMAEAKHILDNHQSKPILLLDDVFSELDTTRRDHILAKTDQYEQCFITTTNTESINQEFLSKMRKFTINNGTLSE